MSDTERLETVEKLLKLLIKAVTHCSNGTCNSEGWTYEEREYVNEQIPNTKRKVQ